MHVRPQPHRRFTHGPVFSVAPQYGSPGTDSSFAPKVKFGLSRARFHPFSCCEPSLPHARIDVNFVSRGCQPKLVPKRYWRLVPLAPCIRQAKAILLDAR